MNTHTIVQYTHTCTLYVIGLSLSLSLLLLLLPPIPPSPLSLSLSHSLSLSSLHPHASYRLEGVLKIVLVIFSLFGFFTFDSVYLFSVLNYVAQAEMNVYLLRDVRQLLLSKKYDNLDGAVKVNNQLHIAAANRKRGERFICNVKSLKPTLISGCFSSL